MFGFPEEHARRMQEGARNWEHRHTTGVTPRITARRMLRYVGMIQLYTAVVDDGAFCRRRAGKPVPSS